MKAIFKFPILMLCTLAIQSGMMHGQVSHDVAISRDMRGLAEISSAFAPYYLFGEKLHAVIAADGEEEIILWAKDEVLNKGETYTIPFYLDRSVSTIGFGFYLVSPENRVEFTGVEVPQITDFTNSDYFITDDFLSMVWLADPSQFGEGVPVSSAQPFLLVHIRANENVILHDAIAIGSQINPQFIPPSMPEYTIRLQWDKEIVSQAIDLPDGRRLALYPNPFTDMLYIDGLSAGDAGNIIIHNAAGQLINYLPLQEFIDVSAWQDGLWYVSLQVDGVLSPAMPVVKIQH